MTTMDGTEQDGTAVSTLWNGIAKPKITFHNTAGDVVDSIVDAESVRLTAGGSTYTAAVTAADPRARMLALYGAKTLLEKAAKANAPVAEAQARFEKITPTAFGDEKAAKPAKTAKPTKYKHQELLDAIRSAKTAANLPFDETATRGKLEDPEYRKKARSEAHVKAELARAKAGSAPGAADTGVGTL